MIEVLSPTNKKTVDGRRDYLKKRDDLIKTRVSLVEIDLLRGGAPMPVKSPPPQTDYRILICRAGRSKSAELYAFSCKSPIPPIAIPLLPGDAEPTLDLNAVLHALIDRARYDLVIDYDRPPQPPFSPEDEPWAAAIIARGIRSVTPESTAGKGTDHELPGPSLSECRPAASEPAVVSRAMRGRAGVDRAGPTAASGRVCRVPGKPTGVNPLAPKAPHHAPKAKRVLFLFMAGAPSHLELFDYKPHLAKFDGTLPPPELLKGYRAAFINPSSKLLGPKFKFARHGQSGTELSELLPHLATVVDDIAVVKGMVTDAFNHAPGRS